MPTQFDGESVWDSFLTDTGIDIEEEDEFLEFLFEEDLNPDLLSRKELDDAYTIFVDSEERK